MKAIKLANTQSERARLKEKCMTSLARAEEIKKAKQWPLPLTSLKPLRAPTSSRALSTHEQLILLEGSKLHGLRFPPWTREPNDDEFRLSDGRCYVYVALPHLLFSHLTSSGIPQKYPFRKFALMILLVGEDRTN